LAHFDTTYATYTDYKNQKPLLHSLAMFFQHIFSINVYHLSTEQAALEVHWCWSLFQEVR
jgi:hypothetical protein